MLLFLRISVRIKGITLILSLAALLFAYNDCTGDSIRLAPSPVSAGALSSSVPVPIVNLSVSPSSVYLGSSSTLSWSSLNANSCVASGAWTGQQQVAGSVTEAPTQVGNFTYTLSCTGSGGTAVQSTILAVNPVSGGNPPPLPTATLSASPATIVAGSSATLTWTSTNASTCTASGSWSGSESPSGNIPVTPATTSTYTLVCADSNGNSSPQSVTVTVTPASGGGTALTFQVNAQSLRTPISPYIYGMNDAKAYSHNIKMVRMGGNRLTAYNWTTNASNAGSDYLYENDNYLSSSSAPGAVATTLITADQSNNVATMITVPIVDYVAGDVTGPVSSSQYAPTAANTSTPRFAANLLTKGAPFSLTPAPATGGSGHVYVDEFVNFLENKFPNAHGNAAQDIFYQLDNEPGLWNSTHPEVHSAAPTYTEMATRTVNAAKAIKSVAPSALVFGGVCYGWSEFVNLQSAPDAGKYPNFTSDYLGFLLNSWSTASASAGKRLVDVLDLHWYPEATGGGTRITDESSTPQAALVAARVQAPRSLWDPTYVETSWITSSSGNAALKLIPWLQAKVSAQNPGTKISFSEYNYGGGSDISGAIAQADVLGIFGKYGVFAANEWQLASSEPYTYAAFDMFEKYDGTHSVGDTSISAVTQDIVNTSIYGMASSTDSSTLFVVLINKNPTSTISANVVVTDTVAHSTGTAYVLKSGNSAAMAGGTVTKTGSNTFTYQMPANSVSTLVIH